MGVDYSQFKFAKGTLRVEAKRAKRLSREEKEREAKAEAKRLYGTRCAVPGCREIGEMHHVEPRSTAPRRRHDPTNLRPVCTAHHQLIHRGKLDAFIDETGEFIVK
jgi:hypothetical protein